MKLLPEELDSLISRQKIIDLTTATIRQICGLAAEIEKYTNEPCIHLELGNPGLKAEEIGIEAEIKALSEGVANKYPDIAGVPALKEAGSEFVKAFLDLDIPPKYIVPTVGSMQACYTLLTLLKQRLDQKDTLLLLSPGFPAQKHQAKMIGMNLERFDIADYRGEALKNKLEEILKSGRITAMLYSNPNNPSWSNFTEEELQIIGECATKYDVIIVEDLAYMGMDFRKDYSIPYQQPFIPTVGKFTDNYILMISASKIFSYAGQRVAIVCFSPEVFNRSYPVVRDFYEMANFGEAYIYGVLYTASSGVTHSAQYAMAAMLEKAVKKELPFIAHTKEYGERGAKLKDIFKESGFHLVYEKDGKEEISDGFFFTVGYKDLSSEALQRNLLRYGIASISLPCTGSTKEGVRVCVSMMNTPEQFNDLKRRLKEFQKDEFCNSK